MGVYNRQNKMSEFLELKLENASLDEIAELALKAVEPNSSENKSVNVKDVSGNSGAKKGRREP